MLQQDSINHAQTVQPEDWAVQLQAAGTEAAPRPSRPQTPYQVLRMLPKDATPAQQDSAIQAWFQPGEIHYSDRPDTLHLPGHGVGKSMLDVNLPKYYKENFFSNDSLFHPELNGGRYGMPGDPVPYTIRGDNSITILLLLCFIVAVVSFAHSRQFFQRQLKELIYIPRQDAMQSETTGELRIQLFLLMHTCLQLGILAYLYVTHYVGDTFVFERQYYLIGLLFALMLGYFFVKSLIYSVVNLVFFDGKKNVQWMKSLLFIAGVEGLLLLPAVLLQAYFDFPMQNIVYYFIFVLVFVKIITFYKCWIIFFRQIGFFLQIILYFCALEIVPLLAFGGALALIVNELTINF